jgi:hypothetical protein
MENEIIRFSNRINESISTLKIGPILIWGDCHGKPFYGVYKIESSSVDDNKLIMNFDNETKIIIKNPKGCTLYTGYINVRDADCVRLEYKQYFKEHKKFGKIIIYKSNRGFKRLILLNKSLLAFEIYPDQLANA